MRPPTRRMPEVGERILGTVVKTTTFGAFVNIAPRPRRARAHLQARRGPDRAGSRTPSTPGDQIEVEVTDRRSSGQISLTPVAWLERQVAQGKTIEEATRRLLKSGAAAAVAVEIAAEAATGRDPRR